MGSARTSIATLVATMAIALGALGLAVASPGHPRTEATFSAVAGALGLTSTRDGETLFAAGQMRPGQAVSGTLRVTNTGDAPEILAVRTSGLDERAGIGGGLLSGRLALIISDVSGDGAPVQLWSGRPRELAEARLATLARGEARDLVVTAALAAAGATNAYQGASVSARADLGRPAAGRRGRGDAFTDAVGDPRTGAHAGAGRHARADRPDGTRPRCTRAVRRRSRRRGRRARAAGRERVPEPAQVHDPPARAARRPGGGGERARRAQAGQARGRPRPAQGRRRGQPTRGFRQRRVAVRIDLRTTDGQRYRSTRSYRICAGR